MLSRSTWTATRAGEPVAGEEAAAPVVVEDDHLRAGGVEELRLEAGIDPSVAGENHRGDRRRLVGVAQGVDAEARDRRHVDEHDARHHEQHRQRDELRGQPSRVRGRMRTGALTLLLASHLIPHPRPLRDDRAFLLALACPWPDLWAEALGQNPWARPPARRRSPARHSRRHGTTPSRIAVDAVVIMVLRRGLRQMVPDGGAHLPLRGACRSPVPNRRSEARHRILRRPPPSRIPGEPRRPTRRPAARERGCRAWWRE